MTLVERVLIKAPPESVWNFLVNPENFPLWNPKVKAVELVSTMGPQRGFRYNIRFQMRERSQPADFQAVFEEFEPFSRLVIRQTEGCSPEKRVIRESYLLAKDEMGTLLTQTIDLSESRINIIFRAIIWLIQRWGRPTGTPYLEVLRDLVEKAPAPPGSVP